MSAATFFEPALRFLTTNIRWVGAGAVLTFLSSFGQTFFISVFSGSIQAEFSLTHGEWGSIYALGTGASAIVMIWAGSLTDVFRVYVTGPIFLGLLAMSCLLLAMAPTWWVIPIAIFMLRLTGQGMTSHIARVAMARWFAAARGKALAFSNLGYSVGEAALPILATLLLTVWQWQFIWVAAAVLILIATPFLRMALHQERTPQAIAKESQSLGMENRAWSRTEMLRHPLFWCVVPSILGPSAFVTAFFFHHQYFAEINGWSHLEIVALFPLFTVLGTLSMVGTGFLIDRIGTPKLMLFYLLPMSMGFAMISWSTTIGGVGVGLALVGISAGANSTLPGAYWAEFYGTQHLGSIKAMATAVMVLGSAIGPLVTGQLIDLGISYHVQLLAISGYFVGASLLIWLGLFSVRRTLPRPL